LKWFVKDKVTSELDNIIKQLQEEFGDKESALSHYKKVGEKKHTTISDT
jgi:hypothetical protein